MLTDLAAHRDALGARAFTFRHSLGDDPRFDLDRLADLVPRLPSAWVLAHEAQFSPHERRGKTKVAPGTDLGRAIADLPTSGVSIRAYNLENTTDFRPILDATSPAVLDFVDCREGGVRDINLATFVASTGAVTAAHPDRHHNFLLNVQGRKQVWIGCDPDPRAQYIRTLDWFRRPHLGAPDLPPAETFSLAPGDAIYIPPYAWHWTEVLDDGATGFSVGFSTATTERNEQVLGVDMRLRALGLHPRPFDMHGAGGVSGRCKAAVAPAVMRAVAFKHRSDASVVVSPNPQEVPR